MPPTTPSSTASFGKTAWAPPPCPRPGTMFFHCRYLGRPYGKTPIDRSLSQLSAANSKASGISRASVFLTSYVLLAPGFYPDLSCLLAAMCCLRAAFLLFHPPPVRPGRNRPRRQIPNHWNLRQQFQLPRDVPRLI